MCACRPSVARNYHSSITFKNGSDQIALVKLVGPTRRTVPVPTNESRGESGIAPGRYHLVVRYGDMEKNYTYMKGDAFDVEESGNEYSKISITLYTVANGNLGSHPARKEEFEKPR
jgi:hypothetical protein